VTLRWLSLLARCALALCAACGGGPPRNAPSAEPADPPSPVAPVPANPPGDGPMLVPQTSLPNGLQLVLLRPTPGTAATADLQLGIVAGADNGKQAVTDLAIAFVLRNDDTTAGRPGLQRSIAAMGGTLTLEQGQLTTWLTVRVPAGRWRNALHALAVAFTEPPPGRGQLERLHREILADRVAEVERAPERTNAERLLLGDAGTGDHLTALQDRDPGEAVLFRSRNFRPDRMVLAGRVPADPTAVGAATVAEFGAWAPEAIAPDPQAAAHGRKLASGLYWAPGDGPCRASVLLQLPDPFAPDGVPETLLFDCMTMDGVGGRLEKLLRDSNLDDVVFTPSFVACGEATALLLTTTTTPERAVRIWHDVQAARRSLRDLPPTADEIQRARTRARLTVRRSEIDPRTALRTVVTRAMRHQDEARLQAKIAELDALVAVSPETLLAFEQLPAAVFVIGGQPPADAVDVRKFELVPPALRTAKSPANGDERISAAVPWLERALDAAGGRERIETLAGFTTEATTTAEKAPEIDESVQWSANGTAHRQRKVLGSVVDTDFTAKSWTESNGSEKVQLSPTEARWQMCEIERHPLALLIAWAKGQLRFRLVATRVVDDRERIVLEAVGQRFDRLRVELDRESALVRAVEAWTTSPQGTPTSFVDTWSDERSVDGLRLPFRRVTVVDDGQSRRVTTYSKIKAVVE
jgi:hypothetical protein